MNRTLKHVQTAGAVALVAFSLMIVAPSAAEPEVLRAADLSAMAAAMDAAPAGLVIEMEGYLWDEGYLHSDNEVLYLNLVSTLAYLWEDQADGSGGRRAELPIPDPNGYLWSDFEFIDPFW